MAKKGFNPEEYIHLVRYFTRKFVSKNPTFAHLEEDIKGQCFEEMVRASKRHDPEAGAVSTYCWNYFRSAARKCLAHTNAAVSTPEDGTFVTCRTMIEKIRREAEQHTEYKINPTAAVDLQKMLGDLPERTAKILVLKHGLFGSEKYTYQEIGEMMGVSKQRIHQLEKIAFSKLRKKHVPQLIQEA